MIEDYEESQTPLVVASAHRAPVDALGAREGWATITGDTPAAKRAEIVKRFQDGNLKGVALTIQAGGVGLTLTRASTMIFVDLDWTPGNNVQCEDRICRIGQRADSVLVIRMVSDHPLDRHILEILKKKMCLIETAIESTVTPTVTDAPAAPTLVEETDEELAARIAAAAREVELASAREKIQSHIGKYGCGSVMEVVLTDDLRSAIRGAHEHMLARCDGARIKDGAGFNKPDAYIMHWLGRVGYEDDQVYRLAWSILLHYPQQLRGTYPDLWRVTLKKSRAVGAP